MSGPVIFNFRLYVAGDTQNSAQAVANLTTLCRTYLPGQHKIELVDVFREPKRALEDHILMTPILIKLSPPPAARVIGTLNETQLVLQALGMDVA